MNTLPQAFFLALGMYLSTFNTSPAHSFINDNSIPLQTKIALMSDAVTKKIRI
jgi:hypothetical protein